MIGKMKIIASLLLVLTLLGTQTYGFGVAYSNNYLNLDSGETISYYTSIQNMANYNELVTVSINDPDNIVTNKEDIEGTYQIYNNTQKNPLYLDIKMPDNPTKSRYKIEVSYKSEPTGNEAVSLSSGRQITVYVDYNSPLCVEVDCTDICDGSTRNYLGYCSKDTGECIYEIQENSNKCPVIDNQQEPSPSSSTSTNPSNTNPSTTEKIEEEVVGVKDKLVDVGEGIVDRIKHIIPEEKPEGFSVVKKKTTFEKIMNVWMYIVLGGVLMVILLRKQVVNVVKLPFRVLSVLITFPKSLFTRKPKDVSYTPISSKISFIKKHEMGFLIGVLFLCVLIIGFVMI